MRAAGFSNGMSKSVFRDRPGAVADGPPPPSAGRMNRFNGGWPLVAGRDGPGHREIIASDDELSKGNFLKN